MKLFGAQRDPAPQDGGRDKEASFLQARWFRALLTVCGVLLVVAACLEGYRRAAAYGTKVVEAHPVDARIEIKNPPKWLDPKIVAALLDESYAFAQKDEATYNRARNILDSDVLREIAALYTGTDTVDGKPVSRQATGFNAWIKRVTEVRRNVAKDNSVQTIEIYADWRTPAAWVRAKAGDAAAEMLYLIDAEGVRLPGDYAAGQSRANLMVIAGVDLPAVGGKPGVPAPGQPWAAGKGGKLGDDLAAGMKLVTLLQGQQFAHQIDAVDMANYNGRRDPRAAWILLATVWKTADGAPRVVQWGRPAGEERYYEVQAAAKLKVLNDLYLRFSRIDADRDYVDIRTELVRLPKLASQADPPVVNVRG